jgi:hypothetical protein
MTAVDGAEVRGDAVQPERAEQVLRGVVRQPIDKHRTHGFSAGCAR